jgi:hypothetical protein
MKTHWQKAALFAAIVGMEGCCLYALTALLDRQAAGGSLSVIGLLVVYPLAFAVDSLLRWRRWPRVLLWCTSWLAWVIIMLLIVKVQLFGGLAWSDMAWLLAVPRSIPQVIYQFRPELLVLLLTAAMWWLGRRVARLNPGFTILVSEFQFGLMILVIIFLLASRLPSGTASPVPVSLTFFFFALAGTSVAHALEGKSWLAGLDRGRWSLLLLMSIGVILTTGLLISLIFTPDFLHWIAAAIRWLWGIVWTLVEKLMSLLAGLFAGSGPVELPPTPTMPTMPPEESFHFSLPPWLGSGLRLGWEALMAGFFIFALWRISTDVFRWLRRRLAGTGGAEFEPLRGAFTADILNFFKRVLSRLLAIRLPFLAKKKGGPPGIASVRQTYRQLLRRAAAAGLPRERWQTPQEYYFTLAGRLPEDAAELSLVTQLYAGARYGARLATPGELDELGRAWQRLKQARFKRMGKEANRGE